MSCLSIFVLNLAIIKLFLQKTVALPASNSLKERFAVWFGAQDNLEQHEIPVHIENTAT